MGITIGGTHRFFILRTNPKPIKDLTKEVRMPNIAMNLYKLTFFQKA
jgi:hypothetical protein